MVFPLKIHWLEAAAGENFDACKLAKGGFRRGLHAKIGPYRPGKSARPHPDPQIFQIWCPIFKQRGGSYAKGGVIRFDIP